MATKALYERAVPSLSFTLWTAGIAFFAGLYFLPLYQYVLTGYSAGFTESMRRYATVYLYRVDRMIGNKELDGNTARKLWRHRGEVAATLLRIKQDWPSKPALVVDNTIVEPPNQFEAEGPPIIEPFGSSTSNA